MNKLAFIILLVFTGFNAHAGVRLDHEFGSIYVSESSLCSSHGYFYLKDKTYTYCSDLRASAKTNRCIGPVEVVPSRAIHSIERVCVVRNPSKNSTAPCLKTEMRNIDLPTTYEIVEPAPDYKHPSRRNRPIQVFEIPACTF